MNRANNAARTRARAAGRDTYPHEVLEMWTGCVECGEPIIQNVIKIDRPGLYRSCECPDVLWRCLGLGWVKV